MAMKNKPPVRIFKIDRSKLNEALQGVEPTGLTSKERMQIKMARKRARSELKRIDL